MKFTINSRGTWKHALFYNMTYIISWLWLIDGILTEEVDHKVLCLVSGLSLSISSFLLSHMSMEFILVGDERKKVLDDMMKLGEMKGMAKASNHYNRGGDIDGLKAKINILGRELNIDIEHENIT